VTAAGPCPPGLCKEEPLGLPGLMTSWLKAFPSSLVCEGRGGTGKGEGGQRGCFSVVVMVCKADNLGMNSHIIERFLGLCVSPERMLLSGVGFHPF
jgi:hypothetical protein